MSKDFSKKSQDFSKAQIEILAIFRIKVLLGGWAGRGFWKGYTCGKGTVVTASYAFRESGSLYLTRVLFYSDLGRVELQASIKDEDDADEDGNQG